MGFGEFNKGMMTSIDIAGYLYKITQ